MNPRTFFGASVVAAVVASFCCILPIVFAVAGISIVGASAAFAAWRPFLLAATFALLGLGFYFAYRPAKQVCEPDAACARPGIGRSGRLMLWTATILVLAFAAFPYYSGPVAKLILSERQSGVATAQAAPKLERVVLAVEGMDCPACASTIEKKLKAIPGVGKARVSYEKGQAEVQYDRAAVGLGQIESAIKEAGYRVHQRPWVLHRPVRAPGAGRAGGRLPTVPEEGQIRLNADGQKPGQGPHTRPAGCLLFLPHAWVCGRLLFWGSCILETRPEGAGRRQGNRRSCPALLLLWLLAGWHPQGCGRERFHRHSGTHQSRGAGGLLCLRSEESVRELLPGRHYPRSARGKSTGHGKTNE